MFDKFKKKLFFLRCRILLTEGVKNKEILPFEDDLYERLSKIYFNGIPLSIHIKYLKPMFPPGQCEDRSMFIAMGLENALWVCGDQKDLELLHGKDSAWHYWIEHNGWVYDPTLLHKFKKELYYKIYKITNVKKCRASEYMKKVFWKEILDTKIDDLKPGGKERYHLCVSIPLVQYAAEFEAKMNGNDSFLRELNEYLKEIEYSPDKISYELTDNLNKLVKKRTE